MIMRAIYYIYSCISPEGRRPKGDISAKLPRTAVYIVYSPNNHGLYDIFHKYISSLFLSCHFNVGGYDTPIIPCAHAQCMSMHMLVKEKVAVLCSIFSIFFHL